MTEHRILEGDVLAGLRTLPDGCVQCTVTSPPYFALRDYGVDGQIGLEETPEQFIQKMVEVFREVRRVTRDDGVLWLNLGDSYATNGIYIENYKKSHPEHDNLHIKESTRYPDNRKGIRGGEYQIKAKDLMGIPWRVAFALQADGWYLRSAIPWIKRNCMPESTTDRPTSAIEYIFLMAKSARYFYDSEAVRMPIATATVKRASGKNNAENRKDGGEAVWQGGLTPEQQDKYYSNITTESTRNYRNSDPFFESWQGLYSERENPLAFIINPQARPELHFACVDDQTEALTTEGWRNIHCLKDHDQIVAFDGVKLSWQEATFHRYPFSGKMVTVNTRDVSMWLTPNHRVVCRDYQDKGDWKIKQADRLKGYEEVPTAAPFDCDTTGELINKEVAELAGWVLTDGSYNKGNTISLYQTGGRGKHEKIEALFNALKVKYSLYQRDRGHGDERSYNFSGEVANFIKQVFPLKEGNFGILATWNERDLRALWVGMTEGDGNQRKDGRITFVGNRSKVDFYQALCIRLGMTCRVSPRSDTGNSFAAFVSKKKTTSLRGTNGDHNVVKQDCYYDGIVWCPSVRSGMWLARRNGRPFITGNTFPDLLAETCIKAGTSEYGCCPKCGAPWERIVEAKGGTIGEGTWHPHDNDDVEGQSMSSEQLGIARNGSYRREFKGWQPGCKCGETDRVPCVVLDPFMGSGTVAVVARELNRSSIGCELNPEYVKIIRKRLQVDSQLDTGTVSYRFDEVPA